MSDFYAQAPIKDLLVHLGEQYNHYRDTGKVKHGSSDFELPAACVADGSIDSFIKFAKAYLTVNRISSSGYQSGMLGVTLSDGLHYPIVDVKPPSTNDYSGSVSISSTAGQFDLPPAHSIPITKGG